MLEHKQGGTQTLQPIRDKVMSSVSWTEKSEKSSEIRLLLNCFYEFLPQISVVEWALNYESVKGKCQRLGEEQLLQQ